MRAAALALVATTACSLYSGDDGGDPSDPDPVRRTFVISSMRIPATSTEAFEIALDLEGNGRHDNQLGALLASLAALGPDLALQGAIDRSIDRGDALALLDVRVDGDRATTRVDLGADPDPAACRGPDDPTCRGHLTGDAGFRLADDFSPGQPLTGTVSAGRLVTDVRGGAFVLPLSLAGDRPGFLALRFGRVELDLARPEAGGRIGGALTVGDIDAVVVPQLQRRFDVLIDRDCDVPAPPDCRCLPGSAGAQLLGFADTTRDCRASIDELRVLVRNLLIPDVDLDRDGIGDAVSFTVAVTAVTARFDAP